MPKKRNTVIRDTELIELFADDPESLAIVDAIAATQRRPRTRGVRPTRARMLAVALAAACAAAVALIVESPSRAGVIEHALAAFPNDRVLHLSLRYTDTAQRVVDLRNGAVAPVVHRFDEWYDARTDVRRVRDSVDGVAIADVRLHGHGDAGFATAEIARFPVLYRRGLSSASDSDVAQGMLRGRRVVWISFARSPLARVAIDLTTYRPLVAVLRGRTTVRRFDVLDVSALALRAHVPASIPAPKLPADRPTRVAAGRLSTLAGSFSYGVLGDELDELRLVPLKTIEFAGRGKAFDILYSQRGAQRGGRFIEIEESPEPESMFGWTPARVALTAPGHALIERNGQVISAFARIRGRAFHLITARTEPSGISVLKRLRAAANSSP